MVRESKKIQDVKAKNPEGIVDAILKGVSYGTGVLVRKAADIGKVSETKSWKKVVSETEDLCEKVNTNTLDMLKKVKKSVKENISDMKESFKEGVESAECEVSQSKAKSAPVLQQSSDNLKIKEVIAEITQKPKIPLSPKNKIKIKDKAKITSKKAKRKVTTGKEASVKADLEKKL